MKMEKSAGFIIYKKEKGKTLYLLLKHPAREDEEGWWSFPGTMENSETPLKTAKRELYEETGILEEEIKINPDFKRSIKYFFSKDDQKVFKIVVFFLAETKKESIKFSLEHTDFSWMEYESALVNLKYEELKNILKEADQFISSLQ